MDDIPDVTEEEVEAAAAALDRFEGGESAEWPTSELSIAHHEWRRDMARAAIEAFLRVREKGE